MIKSRFHFFRFYFALFIAMLFFWGMAAFMLYIFVEEINVPVGIVFLIIRIVLIAVCISIGFYVPLSLIQQISMITIDEGKITFSAWGKEKTYYLRDVEDVKQGIKIPLKFFIRYDLMGTRLRFRDGDVQFIYRDMYANSWKINCWIEDVLVKKGDLRDLGEPQRYAKVLPHEPLKKIEDSGVFNVWGLVLLGMGIFLLYFFLIRPSTPISLLQFGILAGLLAGLSMLFNEFLLGFSLSEKYLQVRKPIGRIAPNFFKLSEIREVRIEDPNSQVRNSQFYGLLKPPYALRVVTQNHKNYTYYGASLKKKHWKEFHARLKKYGVRVKVDAKGLF